MHLALPREVAVVYQGESVVTWLGGFSLAAAVQGTSMMIGPELREKGVGRLKKSPHNGFFKAKSATLEYVV